MVQSLEIKIVDHRFLVTFSSLGTEAGGLFCSHVNSVHLCANIQVQGIQDKLYLSQGYLYGSHIFGLTNFPDFSNISFCIFQYFFSVLFNEFNKYKNLFNYTSSKRSEKK